MTKKIKARRFDEDFRSHTDGEGQGYDKVYQQDALTKLNDFIENNDIELLGLTLNRNNFHILYYCENK